jgi:hypothetical protein
MLQLLCQAPFLVHFCQMLLPTNASKIFYANAALLCAKNVGEIDPCCLFLQQDGFTNKKCLSYLNTARYFANTGIYYHV